MKIRTVVGLLLLGALVLGPVLWLVWNLQTHTTVRQYARSEDIAELSDYGEVLGLIDGPVSVCRVAGWRPADYYLCGHIAEVALDQFISKPSTDIFGYTPLQCGIFDVVGQGSGKVTHANFPSHIAFGQDYTMISLPARRYSKHSGSVTILYNLDYNQEVFIAIIQN